MGFDAYLRSVNLTAHIAPARHLVFFSAQHAKRLAKSSWWRRQKPHVAVDRRIRWTRLPVIPLDDEHRCCVGAAYAKEQIFRSREQRRDKTARCLQSQQSDCYSVLTMQFDGASPRPTTNINPGHDKVRLWIWDPARESLLSAAISDETAYSRAAEAIQRSPRQAACSTAKAFVVTFDAFISKQRTAPMHSSPNAARIFR